MYVLGRMNEASGIQVFIVHYKLSLRIHIYYNKFLGDSSGFRDDSWVPGVYSPIFHYFETSVAQNLFI